MPFHINVTDLPHLPESPLLSAVIQIRFAPLLAIEQPAKVADFQEAVSALDHPLQLREQGLLQSISLSIGPDGMNQQDAGPTETVWKFADEKRLVTLDLTKSALTLQAEDYSKFEWFSALLKEVITTLIDTISTPRIKRLGVRYINHINEPFLDNQPKLRQELLVPGAGGFFDAKLVGSMHQIQYSAGENDATLVMRHGLIEPNVYLLDLDCFKEFDETLEVDPVIQSATEFHDTIESLFAWSISDSYATSLGVSS